METDFKKYKPEELIGKTVLHQRGATYSTQLRERLTTIEKVTKTAFRIKVKNLLGEKSIGEELYDLNSGEQKGLSGRQNMATISRCYLVTDDEANELRTKWARAREMKKMASNILNNVSDLTYEQLKQIEQIINPK